MNRFFVFVGEERPVINTDAMQTTINVYEQLYNKFYTLEVDVTSIEDCPDCRIIKGETEIGKCKVRVNIVLNLRNRALDSVKAFPAM